MHFTHLTALSFLPCSPAHDTYDLDYAHDRGQGPETQDDRRHLRVSQWEAPERDQMGDHVEGRSHFPGDPQPKRDGDSTEQLRDSAEPRDPQTEA